ncbi:hypothetical protein [Nocardia puris]|uniref:hypothetical protein n=1 Tax=Nocardia puris TaxID=208602 RepID=UPI0008311890|nr:hypothetical protein [Nocardia puris]
MGSGVEDDAGGILGLLQFLEGHEEAIAADLLDRGRSIHEIGHTISWIELRAWIKHSPPDSRLTAELCAELAEQAKGEDERTIGGGDDSMTIAEMNAYLGWDREEVAGGG